MSTVPEGWSCSRCLETKVSRHHVTTNLMRAVGIWLYKYRNYYLAVNRYWTRRSGALNLWIDLSLKTTKTSDTKTLPGVVRLTDDVVWASLLIINLQGKPHDVFRLDRILSQYRLAKRKKGW